MKYFLSIAIFMSSLTFAVSTLQAQTEPQAGADQQPAASADTTPAATEPAKTEVAPAPSQPAAAPTVTQPTAPAPAPTAPETPAAPGKQKAVTTLDLKGQIESINAEAKTLTVAGKTFTFAKSGKVFFKRKQKSLSDLKVGDAVAVTYREMKDGSLLVSRINK